MKMKASDPRFIPTHTGVLKFTKKYKQMLVDSEDKDFIKLSKKEGKRIAFQMPTMYFKFPGVQPNVNICEPFEGTISRSLFKQIKKL